MGDRFLGEFEQIVLLAVLRLQPDGYGVTLRREILTQTGRDVSPGALYTTLVRLEEKGLVVSRMGDPSPGRGGRARRHVSVTKEGVAALAEAQRAYRNLLSGLTVPGLALCLP